MKGTHTRRDSTRRRQRWLIAALLVMTAFIAAPPFASADSGTGTPSVWTEQLSHAPGQVVGLSGANFAPGDTVSVSLSDSLSGWTSPPVDETVAADGSFTGAPLALPSTFSSSITATATDAATGDTASAVVMETIAPPSFTPMITTDKQDYPPGSVVTVTGSGWPADDNLSVFTNDSNGSTWSQTDQVTTDSSGDFTDNVTLPLMFISNYTVTASDGSGLTATTAFTDGNATSVSGTVTDSVTHAAISGATVTCDTSGGCNATFTTTTDASGNYSFSGGNKLSFNTNGPVTLKLNVSASGHTSGTITINNVNNGDTFANENIALIPSGPTKLAFTNGPFTGTVGQCLGPINIQTQNSSGTATNVTAATTVNLATDNGSTGAGAFYSDSGCSSAATTRTISSGSNSASFFYLATGRGSGSHLLTASATSLTSASQTETINRANQATLSITAPTSATSGAADATITTSGGSGTGAVTFDAGASTACSILSGKLHVTSGTGSCSITATKAADANFNSATSAAFPVTINKANQSALSVTAPNSGTFGQTLQITSTGGSGTAAVTYSVGSSTACAIDGSDATKLDITSGTGTCSVTATKAADNNFNSTTSTAHAVTVNKADQATLSTTGPSSMTYGDTDATITTSGGSGTGTVSFNAGSSAACSIVSSKLHVLSGAGSCSITATKAGDANFNSTTSAAFPITINKKQLDVTASSPADGVYGDPVPTISAIYGGTGLNSFVYSQSASDLDTAPSCSTTYTHAATSTPGTYPTSCGGGVSSNYAFSYHDGSFKVGKAPLDVTTDADPTTVAVDHFSKTYGDPNPPFEVRYSGFVFGQNESVLGGTLAFDTTATQASNVGSYGVSPKGLISSNYAINFNAGTLDINKRPITVKANSVSRVYGDSTPAFSLALVFGSFAGGDGFTSLGTPSYDTGAPVSGHQAVGSYPIVVSGLTSSNYNISYATGSDRGTLTITARPITVTAQYDNRVYNATTSSNKTPKVTSGSIVSGDMGNFTQAYSTKTAGTGKTLTPSGSVADGNSGNNYAITFANNTTGVITTATLTVNGITANNKVWDGNTTATLNTGAGALAGVLGTDIVTLNTGGATGAFVSSAVGTWTVQISGLTISNTDAGNYTLTMPTTTASISPWNAAGKGFYAPVGVANSVFTAAPTLVPTLFNPTYVWNTVKGGQTVPLKFNVFAGSVEKTGADAFTNIATAFQAAKMTSCTNAADTDPVDYTITATGSTTLRYDLTGMQWIYNWQTPKVTATTCYRTYVTFADGSSIEAFFQLSK